MMPADEVHAGKVILRFDSHRARDKALAVVRGSALACYSRSRSSTGGFYVVEADDARRIRESVRRGVSTLRKPYEDLRWCWL